MYIYTPCLTLFGRKKKNLMYTNLHKPMLKGTTAHSPCAGPTALTTKCCSLPAVAGDQAALLASMGEELHSCCSDWRDLLWAQRSSLIKRGRDY